jgi:hypothetical protein
VVVVVGADPGDVEVFADSGFVVVAVICSSVEVKADGAAHDLDQDRNAETTA